MNVPNAKRRIEAKAKHYREAPIVGDALADQVAIDTLRTDLAEAVALLQTLMDVAAEAGGNSQSYDFKPRAEGASAKARAFLAKVTR